MPWRAAGPENLAGQESQIQEFVVMAVPRKPRTATTRKTNGNGAAQPEKFGQQSAGKPVSSAGSNIIDFEEQVRRRAYEIYEAQGRPQGRDQEHWQQAEQELRERTRSA
jgi:hypothetical protein